MIFFAYNRDFSHEINPKIFAPPSDRRNFFKCAPPNLKSWIRPCNIQNGSTPYYLLDLIPPTIQSTTIYPLRNGNDIIVPFCRLSLTRDSFVSATARLLIGTSRTVGSAKKFVRITSGFGGGEFTKTLRKVCTCQKLKFSFLLLEYCKIRECYAVANAFTIRNMYSLFLYMKCNSRKINRPTKIMTKIVTLVHF